MAQDSFHWVADASNMALPYPRHVASSGRLEVPPLKGLAVPLNFLLMQRPLGRLLVLLLDGKCHLPLCSSKVSAVIAPDLLGSTTNADKTSQSLDEGICLQ